jgi:hypothetical protein
MYQNGYNDIKAMNVKFFHRINFSISAEKKGDRIRALLISKRSGLQAAVYNSAREHFGDFIEKYIIVPTISTISSIMLIKYNHTRVLGTDGT